jgi:hypothetical protein
MEALIFSMQFLNIQKIINLLKITYSNCSRFITIGCISFPDLYVYAQDIVTYKLLDKKPTHATTLAQIQGPLYTHSKKFIHIMNGYL